MPIPLYYHFFIIIISFSWKLPLNPIKIPVFYYKANGHIPHTFIFDVCKDQITKDDHIWGLPELEYPGLVKVKIYQKGLMKNFSENAAYVL